MYKYHKEQNELREQASMKEPKMDASQLPVDTAKHYAAMYAYDKYQKHLKSLQRITCDSTCRDVWEDGKLVSDNDFELKEVRVEQQHSETLLLVNFAYPIQQEQESEDELLVETITNTLYSVQTENGNHHLISTSLCFDIAQQLIIDLKQHFTISRKQSK